MQCDRHVPLSAESPANLSEGRFDKARSISLIFYPPVVKGGEIWGVNEDPLRQVYSKLLVALLLALQPLNIKSVEAIKIQLPLPGDRNLRLFPWEKLPGLKTGA